VLFKKKKVIGRGESNLKGVRTTGCRGDEKTVDSKEINRGGKKGNGREKSATRGGGGTNVLV